MSDWLRAVRDVRPTRLAGYAVWHIQHEKVTRMETATPFPSLIIAVVEDNPADVYIIARVLQAHGLPYLLQVLESRQRAQRSGRVDHGQRAHDGRAALVLADALR